MAEIRAKNLPRLPDFGKRGLNVFRLNHLFRDMELVYRQRSGHMRKAMQEAHNVSVCKTRCACAINRLLPSRLLNKVLFAYSADRTYPVGWKVFKSCSGGNASVGVSFCRIINPVADFTSVFLHSFPFFKIQFSGFARFRCSNAHLSCLVRAV